MAHEKNTNAYGPDARKIRELNDYSSERCVEEYRNLPWWRQLLGLGISPQQCVSNEMTYSHAALLSWGLLVRQDGKWDDKTVIPNRFHPRDPVGQHWHLCNNTLYYYDVWSNLHYGYVGAAGGFTESVLLDGAGVEQMGSDVFRGRMPQRSGAVDGLRAFDDPADRAAVAEGIRRYRAGPRHVTAQQLVSFITTSTEITQKPYQA